MNKFINCRQYPNGMEMKTYLALFVTNMLSKVRCRSSYRAVYTQLFSSVEDEHCISVEMWDSLSVLKVFCGEATDLAVLEAEVE